MICNEIDIQKYFGEPSLSGAHAILSQIKRLGLLVALFSAIKLTYIGQKQEGCFQK